MAHHLIFTSMERTLKGGSGYGIAAQTSGIPSVLSDELTKIAAYVEIYPGGDPNRRFNPINYFFYRFNSWYILGRLSSANNDYSGRSNYLGEFFALEQSEVQDCGPASLLLELPFLEAFQGEARQLPFCVIPRIGDKGPGICNQWANITGDPGWGGVLAEKFQTNQPTMVLYDKALQGRNSLALIAESLNFLSPGERWSITFSTHVEGFPKGNQMRLRMLQQGGKQTREFKGNSLCMDLTKKDWLPAGAGILVDAARTGIIHNPVKSTQFANPQSVPNPTVAPRALGTDKDQESLDGASYGLEEERGMPPMPGQGKGTQGQKRQPYSSIPPAKRVEKYQEDWTSPLGQGREVESNLSSVRIPWWLYVVGAVGLLISFVGGIGTGTQINRSGLDEAVRAEATKDKELNNSIEKNNGDLEKQNKELAKSTEELIKVKKEKEDLEKENIKNEKQVFVLDKYKKILTNDKFKLVKGKSVKDEDLIKEINGSLKEVVEFYDKNIKYAKICDNMEGKKYLIKLAEDLGKSDKNKVNEFENFLEIINNTKFNESKTINNITKYDKNTRLVIKSGFGIYETASVNGIIGQFISKNKSPTIELRNKYDKIINEENKILYALSPECIGDLNKLFYPKDFKAPYIQGSYMPDDFFKNYEKDIKIKGSLSQIALIDYIKRLLKKTNDDELFTDKNDKERIIGFDYSVYRFTQVAHKNIIKFYKDNEDSFGGEDKKGIDKFKNAMKDCFGYVE